jgi:hypothetical protein
LSLAETLALIIRNIKENSFFILARLWRAARSYRFSLGLLATILLRLRHCADSSAITTSADRVKQILIIRLDAMGDVVMTTSIFRKLKLIYPDASTTAVVGHNSRELLETNPTLTAFYVLLKREIPGYFGNCVEKCPFLSFMSVISGVNILISQSSPVAAPITLPQISY